MVRINKDQIKGITDERKNSSDIDDDDNAANFKEEFDECCGDQCHINWHDD